MSLGEGRQLAADAGIHDGVEHENAVIAVGALMVGHMVYQVVVHLLVALDLGEHLEPGVGDPELGCGCAGHHLGRLADGIGHHVNGGHAGGTLVRGVVVHFEILS